MTRSIKYLLFIALSAFFATAARANTVTANSCNTSDVQAAINATAAGGTTVIPAGTCTWTSGVTASGMNIQGAGSGQIIAYSSMTLSIGTGSLTLSVSPTNVATGVVPATVGETLTVFELGTSTNYMTGTVTSYSSGTLVMSITSDGGSCGANSLSNCKRWLIATQPQTTIVDNSASTDLFAITESTATPITISGIQFAAGSGGGHEVDVFYAAGGQPVLVTNNWFRNGTANNTASGNATLLYWNDPFKGVIWNNSFDSSPYSQAANQNGAISVQDDSNASGNSWTTPSYMGALDVTGLEKVYVETNVFAGFIFSINTDNNGRVAARYNLIDNGGAFGTHGADTSNYGQRYFEFYDNTIVFNGYNDGTTFNINDLFYLRGGTYLLYNNVIPAVTSTDYGTKATLSMTVMNLQRNSGPAPCWGAGASSAGQYFHAPRQVGMGFVTGAGTSTYPADGYNNTTKDSFTYVGDSEPAYIWGNTGSGGGDPLPQVGTSDYGGSQCSNPDASANYIVSGRNYFNNGTAKPGWSPYTYPHPLTQSVGALSQNGSIAPPTNLTATVQ